MGETSAASFADLLKQYRAAAGLTQEELAERANLSARSMSDLERGVTRRPYAHTIHRLIQALALDEEDAALFQRAARRVGGEDESEESAGAVNQPVVLPLQATPFIGRLQEVEQASVMLRREEVRLLSLTGPGGIGKTRLALEIARGTLDTFPDGVVFVSLASLADPDLVPATIAGAVGVREAGGQPILQALLERLRHKRVLLVLDIFEHLLPARAVVSQFLAACPHLTLLVTSRAILHLSAEHDYPVSPLALPVTGHLPELSALSRHDAVALFIGRAQSVRPNFQMTDVEESLALSQGRGSSWGFVRGLPLVHLGWLLLEQGDQLRGLALLEEALALGRRLEDRGVQAVRSWGWAGLRTTLVMTHGRWRSSMKH